VEVRPVKSFACCKDFGPRWQSAAATPLSPARDVNELKKTFVRTKAAWRRSLAFKLIRIYYACWKQNTPYDGQRYLNALEKNGSPLHKKLQNSTNNAGEQLSKKP
jgi:hypothetical protein